jgi:hypothetical protein
MRKKKKTKKKVSNAVSQMRSIDRIAKRLGLTEQTYRIKQRNEKIQKLTPPNTKRGKEAHIGKTYKKDDSGLAIILQLPFNEKTRDFKKTGEAWVLVTDSLPVVPGKLYYKEPMRCYGKDFAERICLHLEAVEWIIRHRPISDVTGTFMVPFRTDQGEYKLVARDSEGKIVDEQDFFRGGPPNKKVIEYINEFIDRKKAIFKRRAKTKSTPMSKKRKTHTVEKGKPTGKTRKQQPAIQLKLDDK